MTQINVRPTLAGIGPLPQPDAITEPFWAACREGRLVLQRCGDCGTFQHPPEVICHHCLSDKVDWQEAARTGTVYTTANVTHLVYPDTEQLLPYNIVIVEIDATGVRMFGNILGASFDEITIGAPVTLAIDRVAEDVALPRWTLAQQDS